MSEQRHGQHKVKADCRYFMDNGSFPLHKISSNQDGIAPLTGLGEEISHGSPYHINDVSYFKHALVIRVAPGLLVEEIHAPLYEGVGVQGQGLHETG